LQVDQVVAVKQEMAIRVVLAGLVTHHQQAHLKAILGATRLIMLLVEAAEPVLLELMGQAQRLVG
jgi:hypothetical protein